MAFEFDYQRVLDVREIEEDQERAELARIQQRLNQERQKLKDLQQELDELYEQGRRQATGAINPSLYGQLDQYAQKLQNDIQAQRQEIEEWERRRDDQREELVEATQERQVMERLKEHRREAFEKEQRQEEQKRQNEMANQQYYEEHLRDA